LRVPFLAAVAVLFIPRQSHKFLRGFTFLSMLGTLAMSLVLLRTPMGHEYHFNQDFVWIRELGIHYHVAVDGISLWLVLLTTFIMPIATYVSFGSVSQRTKDWCFALLLLEGALIGSFVALDLFLFYLFFELCLVPMYVMIGVWGGQARVKAAIKFFLYTMVGSMLMLAALLYLAHAFYRLTGTVSFDYFDLQRVMLPIGKNADEVFPHGAQFWLWAAFSIAFFIKVPMFPVHTWLPDAHTEAPTAGSIVLAAVMLKLGTYGYLRFSMGLFPEASAHFGASLAGVAVLGGILYGALCAWKQDDFKRLVAYSSVAHLGYVMLGLFACTPASLEGAVLQMVNHGVSTGALFLLVGVIYDRRHTRMVAEFGGLAKVMPLYATMFMIATLASIGLPGTNGFIGEFMVITGTFVSTKLGHFNGIQAAGAAVGVILGALYMLSVVQKVFWGPIRKEENRRLPDMTSREMLAVLPLILAIFVIGFFPNIFLTQIQGATQRVQQDFENRVPSGAPRYFEGGIKLMPRAHEAPVRAGPPVEAVKEAQP
jgi:NADH-quinone oxidoreductase subunit M